MSDLENIEAYREPNSCDKGWHWVPLLGLPWQIPWLRPWLNTGLAKQHKGTAYKAKGTLAEAANSQTWPKTYRPALARKSRRRAVHTRNSLFTTSLGQIGVRRKQVPSFIALQNLVGQNWEQYRI